MSKDHKHIFQVTGCLSQEQIMDYVHDRLSMRDRNKVERHMQECEFCAEAMDGFLLMEGKEAKTVSVLSDINKSIIGKADGRIRWMVAASFALAVLAGGVAYLNSELNPKGKDTGVAVLSKKDSVKTISPEKILGDIKNSDTSIRYSSKDKKTSGELSYTQTRPAEENLVLQENKTLSDGYLPSGEMNKADEIPLEEDRSANNLRSMTSGNAVMKDTFMAPSPYSYDKNLDALKESEQEIVEYSKQEKDVAAKNERSLKKDASPKKKSKAVYKSETAGEISLSDDVSEKTYKPVVNNTVKDGVESYNAKRYSEAIAIFEEVLRTNPDSDEALYYNGLSNFELKNYDKAIQNFDKIKTISKYWEDALQIKAKSYQAKGEKDKAKEVLKQIVEAGGKHKAWAEEQLKE